MKKESVKKPQKKSSPKEMKVKFVKSPTTRYKLASSIGDVAYFPRELAQRMIDEGYAESI